MTVEFRPASPSDYQGLTKLPNGTTIKDLRILTENLPVGFPTNEYTTSQVGQQPHAPHAIHVDATITQSGIFLTRPARHQVPASPTPATPHYSADINGRTIFNSSFEKKGLQVVIPQDKVSCRGRLFPS